jgi:hypothetical protein
MEFDIIDDKCKTEYTKKLRENKGIFYEIYEACGNKFEQGCGSYLIDGRSYRYHDETYQKQELLFHSVKDAKNVLEIGTYMGHSLLIMLLSNPNLKITCIDISDEFTLPAVNILNKHFNNAIRFIKSDSLSALSTLEEKFDFFHIDGNHDNDYISNEFNLVKKLNDRTDNILRVLFDDQLCLPILQQEIEKHYKVLKKIIPYCIWSNVYFEIQL